MRWTDTAQTFSSMPATQLSIIMPVLNEAAGIDQTLAALASLLERGAELIVVDGGSTDGTAERAFAHGARVLAAPPGRALQMNAGARHATGRVLMFLHADTVLPSDADLLVHDALSGSGTRAPRAWGRFDVSITGQPAMLKVIAAMMNLRSRLSGIATGDQAMFMTRDAFAAAGGFAEQPLMEDIDMSRRLLKVSQPACLRARVATSGRRWESRGVWRTVLLMWRLRFAYWRGVAPEQLAALYRYDAAMARIVIFAKAPEPGKAKTRLIPALGADGAAQLAQNMLAHTLLQAIAAGAECVEVCMMPACDDAGWSGIALPAGVVCTAQGDGDLGEKMGQAVDRITIDRRQAAILIGTDCPALDAPLLAEATRQLANHDVVLIPAADGGYVLVGLKAPCPDIFTGMAWSTGSVASETLRRLELLGLSVWLGPVLHDIDEPADLAYLPDELKPGQNGDIHAKEASRPCTV